MNNNFQRRLLAVAVVASSAALFCMGKGQLVEPLSDSAWAQSQWISVVDAPVVTGRATDDLRAADGASWFVADVPNAKAVKSAQWMTSGLGVYDLFVNGERIGEEILKPGFTHNYKTKRSFTYDITDAIRKQAGAVNQLAVQVTPGWWADKIVTSWDHDGFVGKKCAFRGVLKLTYDDGTEQTFGTDTANWKAGLAGKVKHAAIFDGEEYDNREPMGWESAASFKAPEVNQEFQGEVLPTNGAEVYLRRDLALKPVEAYIWQGVSGQRDGEYGKVVITKKVDNGEPITLKPGETLVVDFGQNCAAVPEFAFKADAGTVLTCKVGELLNDGNGAKSRGMDGPEGSVHRLNLRIADKSMRIDYTFAGKGEIETYLPRYTFFGYRFVSITADKEVVITDITSIPVSSITAEMESGKISTGNELVNKLISNTLWGQRSNYLSVPTDCPQRNERLGWTADTQVFTETGSFFANTDRFFHKWLRDLRDSQHPLGGFPGVAPLGQYGYEMSRVGWSDAGVIVPWTVWKQFGDTQIVEDSWASMEKYMQRLADTKYDHNALKDDNGNYQWADWLSYEPLESCGGGAFGPDGPLPEAVEYWNFLSASYWAIDAAMMRDMARAIGKDADKYAKMEAEAKDYIRERFIDKDGNFKTEILNTMQTPALFLLRNGILDGAAKDATIARLRKNFADHGNCLQTGFLGTSILMGTLTDNGMADIAYDLLLQRKNPSWLYSVDNGATTVWERWNSYMLDKGMGPQGMNSFNHYAYGCVCQWLWNVAAGIASDPAAPGFKHIVMKPIPDKRLGSVDAEYMSAAGPIRSAWHYDDAGAWHWTFSIPEGSTASVTLPGEKSAKEYGAGTHTLEIK